MKKAFNFIKKYGFLLFCIISLILPEVLLRSMTGQGFFNEGYVKAVSYIFSVCWIVFFIYVSVFLLPKRAGKIVFSLITLVFTALSVSQYIYHRIFDQFFYLKSIALAGEGTDYLGYALQMVDLKSVLCVAGSLFSLILALVFWHKPAIKGKKRYFIGLIPIVILIATHIGMLPEVHGDNTNQWDTWKKPRVVYKNFNDINKCIEITGLYQLTFRDLFNTVFPMNKYGEEEFNKINEYFEAKGEPSVNSYTSLFEGKNVIVVMMESMDSWMIDKEHTPTLYKMMNEGINFTNYNAPFFGVGFTFSSEFAFNTGFFTPVSAVSASNFSQNSFPYAPARLFKEKGYSVNSFHFNSPDFYNRGIMHKSFGYDKYNSFADFGLTGVDAELDSNILKTEGIYEKMTETTPFFNFFITYSAHLPYTGDSPKLALAKEMYPEKIDTKMPEEKNNIHILASDTDEFFRQLLERLEEDGLLKNTVIIGYTDHFAYGVSSSELLTEWKGDTLSYTVPAFIYAKGIRHQDIDKPMMTIDWAPTLVNLFGLNREGRYIGGDILDPENPGFAYFETWGWMDNNMYYLPSEEELFSDQEEYINEQNQRVKDSIEANDTIVLGDYYRENN